MPGNLVQAGAVVICGHAGQGQPTATNPRVTVAGVPTVALAAPWAVAACPYPPASGGPCVTAVWSVGTTRVTSGGQPLVLSTGVATCAPTGVPLTVTAAQPRVTAT